MMLPVVITLGGAILLAIVVQPFFFILSMFFLAWILAFLLDPIVTWIVRRLPRLPRGLTAALVFFGLTTLILVGLVAIASSVLSSLTNIVGDTTSVPQAIDRLIGPLQTQLDSMGIDIDLTSAVTDAIGQLQQSGADLLSQMLERRRHPVHPGHRHHLHRHRHGRQQGPVPALRSAPDAARPGDAPGRAHGRHIPVLRWLHPGSVRHRGAVRRRGGHHRVRVRGAVRGPRSRC